MKHLFLNLLLIFALFPLLTQAQGLSYQAVARDGSGALMANESLNVRFYVIATSPGGTVVYKETHATNTNDFGLFTLTIGKGTPETGTWNGIDWGADDHFLKVEVDGADMGTTQLENVPYAKVATEMGIGQLTDVNIGTPNNGDVLTWDGSEWTSAAASSSPWTEIGSTVSYEGAVAVGAASALGSQFYVFDTTSSRMVRFQRDNINNGNDIIEIRANSDAPAGAQFIEMQRGGSVEARINTDGSAEFRSVEVDSVLDATTAPERGKLYANSLVVAYGQISFSGSIITDFGIASVTNPSTGSYVITTDKNLVGDPTVITTSYSSSPNDEVMTVNPMSSTANQFEINISDGSGTAVGSAFFFVVFGTVQ